MITGLFRLLTGDPVRAVMLAALALMTITALVECRDAQSARSDLRDARAAVVECQADEAICRAANVSLSADVSAQNAAVESLVEGCTIEIESDTERAIEVLSKPRHLSVGIGTDVDEMNRWLSSY